jgi:hypothetical protein
MFKKFRCRKSWKFWSAKGADRCWIFFFFHSEFFLFPNALSLISLLFIIVYWAIEFKLALLFAAVSLCRLLNNDISPKGVSLFFIIGCFTKKFLFNWKFFFFFFDKVKSRKIKILLKLIDFGQMNSNSVS